MFEKFLAENANDFRQRYEGTYGYFVNRESNKRVFAQIRSIDLDARPRMVHFMDARGLDFSVRSDADADIGFEFLPAKSSFYNTAKGLYYTQRVAARQFYRGIKSSNTMVYKIENGVWNQLRVDFNSLVPIFEECLEWDKLNIKGVNASTNLALSSSFCLSGGNLFVFSDKIGELFGEFIQLNDRGNLFLPEVKKALEMCNLKSIEVVFKGS